MDIDMMEYATDTEAQAAYITDASVFTPIPLFRPSDIPTGLVGYWKFDNNANDSSANGYNLTAVNSPTYTDDTYWKDGEKSTNVESSLSQYFSVASSPNLNITGSYSFYISFKAESFPNPSYLFGTGAGTGFSIGIGDGSIIRVYNANDSKAINYQFVVGKWTVLSVVFNSSTGVALGYIDGNLVGTVSVSTPDSHTGSRFVGAFGQDGYLYCFDGSIKDLAVWNVALTSIQIKSLAMGVDLSKYAYRPNNVSVQPTLWWKLNEPSGDRFPANGIITSRMTSNTSPSGIASAYSEYDVNYQAWKAFDRLTPSEAGTTGWASDAEPSVGTPQWLKYQLPSAKTIKSIVIVNRNYTEVYSPKTFTIEGSNDDSAWTTLLTVTNDTNNTQAARRGFVLTTTGSYLYYKMNITETNEAGYVVVGDLEMYDGLVLNDNATVLSSGGYVEGVAASLASASSEYFTAADSDDWTPASGNFSFRTRIKWADTNEGGIFTHSTDLNNRYYLRYEAGVLNWACDSSGASVMNFTYSFTPVVGVFYDLAFRRNGNNFECFIDGVQVGSTETDTDAIPNFTGLFAIGCRQSGTAGAQNFTAYFNGQMEDTAWWKGYALTDAEIKSLACALPIQRQGIIAYYKLEDTADSIGVNTLTNNGTVTFSTAQVNNGANIASTGSKYLSIADASVSPAGALDLASDMTIMCWDKSATSAGSRISKYHTSPEYGYKLAVDSSGNIIFIINAVLSVASVRTLSSNVFAHICGLFDGAANQVYMNGSYEATRASTAAPTENTFPVQIGAENGTTYFPTTLIDEVVLAKRYFRPEEIKAVYLKGLNGKEATSSEIQLALVLQSYSSTLHTQGFYSLKGVAAITGSLNKTLTRTF